MYLFKQHLKFHELRLLPLEGFDCSLVRFFWPSRIYLHILPSRKSDGYYVHPPQVELLPGRQCPGCLRPEQDHRPHPGLNLRTRRERFTLI